MRHRLGNRGGSIGWGVLSAMAFAWVFVVASEAQDIIHLTTGEVLKGKIESMDQNGVKLRLTLQLDKETKGSSARMIPVPRTVLQSIQMLPPEPPPVPTAPSADTTPSTSNSPPSCMRICPPPAPSAPLPISTGSNGEP